MVRLYTILVMAIAACAFVPSALAKPQYASETNQSCSTCHLDPSTGELNKVGKSYRLSHTWPPQPGRPYLHFFFGFLHILSAVAWIGAIIFVHIIHTPHMVAAGGAPRKELALGWSGMAGVAISGTYLTWARSESFCLKPSCKNLLEYKPSISRSRSRRE